MKVRVPLLATIVSFTARTACAEPATPVDLASGTTRLHAQAHFGVATTPFDVSALSEAKGQAFVFLAGGNTALSETFSLELRAPLVLGSVAQPAGSYVDAAAFGNPELGARYRFVERHSVDSSLAVSAALGIGVPLAGYDENLMPNRLLAVADGIEGRGHPQWFTPGVVPFTPSTAFQWESASWVLATELRLPLLVRISEADLPSATTNTQSLGFAGVLEAEVRYRLSQRLSLATTAHLFLDLLPVAEHVRNVSPVQDFERLSLHIHLGSSAALIVDLQTALGGELGGSTVAGGLRAAASF